MNTMQETVAVSAATAAELRAPITGGRLAARYAEPSHGLTVCNLNDVANRYALATDRALTVVWNREQAATEASACCEACARRAARKLADAEALLDSLASKWDAVIITAARHDVRGARSVASLAGLEY